jgi:hypothetical protein
LASDPGKIAPTLVIRARRLTGNPIQILDYDLDELRRRAGSQARVGKDFWDALRRDSIVLAGASVDSILTGDGRRVTSGERRPP